MLVETGAAVLAGGRLDAFALVGITLVCGGIFALAREKWGGKRSQVIVPALLTGVTIAAYTVVDGLGSRASGNAWSYVAWLFLANGLSMLPVWAWRLDPGRPLRLDAATGRSAAGGIVSLAAYASVIWAASISPMGPVSALRESSVVVAAVLGLLFLGERLGRRRLFACLVVASGATCIGLRG